MVKERQERVQERQRDVSDRVQERIQEKQQIIDNKQDQIHDNSVTQIESSSDTQNDNSIIASESVTAAEVPRNPRASPEYKFALGTAINGVGEAAKKMTTAIPKELANHIETVLKASNDPELRALANLKWLTFIAGQRDQVTAALRILEVARSLDPAPQPNCPPSQPSCLPPPTEEPANCDPHTLGSCFPESGNSPCTPALTRLN